MARSKKSLQKLALARVEQLFAFACQFPAKADRYVYLARKVSMKVNLTLPSFYKRRFCKFCHGYLSSATSRVRTRKGKLVVSCLRCKKHYRRPF